MITITPEMTAEQLGSLSTNLKNTIISLTMDLRTITDALNARNEDHEIEVENLKNRHAAELAALIDSHNDMTEVVESNRAFISAVENLLGDAN